MTIEEARKRVKELSESIKLRAGMMLTSEQSGMVDDEEARLDFRLNELLKESEKRQKDLADEITLRGEELKIKSMEKILEIIK